MFDIQEDVYLFVEELDCITGVTRVELGCSLDPSKMSSNQIFSGYSTWETLWNDK